MTGVARVRAQAKINLFLRILAREESGYHALETLFARVGLADTVTVRPTAGGRTVDCTGADVGPMESNLGYRAALAYAAAAGWPAGFAITIDKAIPAGGGLGGGSADAGAVLRALNALSPSPLTRDALLEIAGTLGADVPFMTLESPVALAWGRGDRMLELPSLPAAAIHLAVFGFGVASADAYGWVAETRARSGYRVAARAVDVRQLGTWEGIARLATNDFEPEVSRRHPEIAVCLAAARERGAVVAQLSGSGATVFAVPPPGERAAFGELPTGARLVETTTASSVEDVVVIR